MKLIFKSMAIETIINYKTNRSNMFLTINGILDSNPCKLYIDKHKIYINEPCGENILNRKTAEDVITSLSRYMNPPIYTINLASINDVSMCERVINNKIKAKLNK